ncbi:hypothetical protein H5410_054984 [Solanum commersonii]|uniref:Uncharacterized protein n=1 Tax=Solanum commersonii TaxID=4109 RepID=A0A9J5WGW5_SOLCO|nr:hypothetical protein H5410_054984 [Solanum commersonii]
MDEMWVLRDGSSGGILIMWDSRVWMGSCVEEGKYSITYKFEGIHDGFVGFILAICSTHRGGVFGKKVRRLGSYVEAPGSLWGLQHYRTMARKERIEKNNQCDGDFELDRGYGVT